MARQLAMEVAAPVEVVVQSEPPPRAPGSPIGPERVPAPVQPSRRGRPEDRVDRGDCPEDEDDPAVTAEVERVHLARRRSATDPAADRDPTLRPARARRPVACRDRV